MNLHRFAFIFVILLFTLSLTALIAFASDSADSPPCSTPPNVVLFVSDDMGWNDLGYTGGLPETPNIDRLSAEGVQLDRFYVFPICSPTRAALMTGRSPIRFGVTHPIDRRDIIPADERFMPLVFRDAGYQTFMAGKWHLGTNGEEFMPQGRGFDHFYGDLGGVTEYYNSPDLPRRWQRNDEPIVEDGYSTDLFADEAIDWIKNRDRTKPVFIYLPFNAPHNPCEAPEEIVQKYQQRGFLHREATRMAAIDALDHAIGRVLATIDEQEMTENTLVMFFCDNGPASPRERPEMLPRGPRFAAMMLQEETPTPSKTSSARQLRGGKSSVYEGGIYVPAVIRWPGVVEQGGRCDQLISVLDLLPTIAAAVEIPVKNEKPLDGENMWPSIRDGQTAPEKEIVLASGKDLAIIHDNWKLVLIGEERELFNLEVDPRESRDISADEPDIVTHFSEKLAPYVKMLENVRTWEPPGTPQQGTGRPPRMGAGAPDFQPPIPGRQRARPNFPRYN
jgi:arylsulfatase A-like enzyme